MPLDGSHADTRIQVHKEDGRNPSAWQAELLNQVFVFNIICSNFLGFGGGKKKAPVEARDGIYISVPRKL